MKTIAAAFSLLLVLLSACTSVPPPPASAQTPATVQPSAARHPAPAREYWIDLMSGEEVSNDDLLKDLATASVIYVGETHTIVRHHIVQLQLLQDIFMRGVSLVLCLEQLEAVDQPVIDRFNRREIDFATLAREINWAGKWRNYTDYQPVCEFARQHGLPVRALNAPADLIRTVSRSGGVAHLAPEQRAQLPADLVIDDPVYEHVTNLQLVGHAAADPARLRPMFEAQMARDETMAANIINARHAAGGQPRTAFVILGAGHVRYGLGTPASVRRRDPHVIERVILVSESGQLVLSEAEKRASRETSISHADLRPIERPPGDYLRVLPESAVTLPAGHPPIGAGSLNGIPARSN